MAVGDLVRREFHDRDPNSPRPDFGYPDAKVKSLFDGVSKQAKRKT